MVKKWTFEEESLVHTAVMGHKYVKDSMSIYSCIKLLKIFLPDRSWESIRSKFNKLRKDEHKNG